MGRVSYDVSEENRRRIDLLIAFGILNGSAPTKEQLVNDSIRLYFHQAYDDYCDRADANDLLKRIMKQSL